jgi:hypothetical protein
MASLFFRWPPKYTIEIREAEPPMQRPPGYPDKAEDFKPVVQEIR